MRKHSLAAAAALLACTQGQAQSTVTIYGVLDAAVQYGRGALGNRWQVGSGGMATTRLGFRGVEDLGGGSYAAFNLESQIAADTGNGTPSNTNNQTSGAGTGGGLTWNRRSVVSVGGQWGEVILGRDYTTIFWNQVLTDPFTVNGVGTSMAFTGRITGTGLAAGSLTGNANALSSRASNSVSYTYGFARGATTLNGRGGFFAHLMGFVGENLRSAPGANDGNGGGLRVGYNGGHWTVAFGHLRGDYTPTTATPAPGAVVGGDITVNSLAVVYDFTFIKLSGLLERDTFGPRSADAFTLGAVVPLPVGYLRGAYSGYETDATGSPSSRKLALGYVYDFSKRTALYATVAQVRNTGGASQALNGATTAVNGRSTGLDVGLRHNF